MCLLQVNALLARFDCNSDGQIDYREFLMFYPEAKAAYVLLLLAHLPNYADYYLRINL